MRALKSLFPFLFNAKAVGIAQPGGVEYFATRDLLGRGGGVIHVCYAAKANNTRPERRFRRLHVIALARPHVLLLKKKKRTRPDTSA